MWLLRFLLGKGFKYRFIVKIRVGNIVIEPNLVLLVQVSEVNFLMVVVTIRPSGVLIELASTQAPSSTTLLLFFIIVMGKL